MNAKEFEQDCLKSLAEQDAIMNKYKALGYVKDSRDEQGLHMSFSPYRVPKRLTKLQVRRRINKYWKHGNPKPLELLTQANTLSLTINGKQIVRASFVGKVPDSHRKLQNLVRALMWAK